MKVASPYSKDYQGVALRNNYYVVNSNNLNNFWISGKGIIKQNGNLIIGTNSNFKNDVSIGDILISINQNDITKYFHSTTTNPKFIFSSNCTVIEILSNNFLITNGQCSASFNNKGDYIISKSLYQFNQEDKLYKSSLSLIDINTIESLSFDTKNKTFSNLKNFFYHTGFILQENQDVVLKFELERM